MALYRSKYYALKADIEEQNITIENALKIKIFHNLGPALKTDLIVVKNLMQKDEQFVKDEPC